MFVILEVLIKAIICGLCAFSSFFFTIVLIYNYFVAENEINLGQVIISIVGIILSVSVSAAALILL